MICVRIHGRHDMTCRQGGEGRGVDYSNPMQALKPPGLTLHHCSESNGAQLKSLSVHETVVRKFKEAYRVVEAYGGPSDRVPQVLVRGNVDAWVDLLTQDRSNCGVLRHITQLLVAVKDGCLIA